MAEKGVLVELDFYETAKRLAAYRTPEREPTKEEVLDVAKELAVTLCKMAEEKEVK